ncbi:MTA/SAH nucleosidase [Geomonas limicola]|uniref:MTA/SAH nucleosidase n=1 Tax=Geomonas limicola TaxID=2740186 RepID=A0A6V8NDI7_9BACT|nr:nucleoside phosphorylase [Geomonas limicola]GFO70692.1 MTA/SAH nucleosidase [Geomonas limicola]
MGITGLGLVAAMPEEIAPLLRRVGKPRKEHRVGYNWYRFEVSGVPVTLIESGMGLRHAQAATRALIEDAAPQLLLNFGFTGAVRPGLEVADLVLAERVLFLAEDRVIEQPIPAPGLVQAVSASLASGTQRMVQGTVITAASITSKQALQARLPSELPHPVLDMESAAFMTEAARAGIPALVLRCISDAADEELGFSLDEFCDADLKIRLPRVLWTIARKPRIIPQLIRLADNTSRAGKSLATGVHGALETLVEVLKNG